MRRPLSTALAALAFVTLASPASAFCGFFVAKADGDLFNESSKVVMTRKDGRTVITMANDFKGDMKDFAMVIPVPVVLRRDQIRVSDNALIDRLDAYSAPRIVEYEDKNPCPKPWAAILKGPYGYVLNGGGGGGGGSHTTPPPLPASVFGVTIEAEYAVGDYDIVILSADQSTGLLDWLKQENYRLPEGAAAILSSYIKQDMKFFVARINLQRMKSGGFTSLKPLRVEFQSGRFMLPIRLGTLNAKAPQDLILLTITERGRVETTNYPVRLVPTGMDVPMFVQKEFPQFYNAVFDRQVEQNGMGSVFLEYAWSQGTCDPCVGEPPDMADLKALGVWWTDSARRIFVTRLHARYTAKTFPEDLMLHETGDRSNFQARYITRKPWTPQRYCPKLADYYQKLTARFEKADRNLSQLTGESMFSIRKRSNRKSFVDVRGIEKFRVTESRILDMHNRQEKYFDEYNEVIREIMNIDVEIIYGKRSNMPIDEMALLYSRSEILNEKRRTLITMIDNISKEMDRAYLYKFWLLSRENRWAQPIYP